MDNTEAPKKRLLTGLRIVLLFALLVCAFIGYTRWFVNQRVGNQQIYDNLAVFDTRLQNLEKSTVHHEERIKELEETLQKLVSAPPPAALSTPPASSPPATPTIVKPGTPTSSDDTRITVLENEITSLKASAPTQSAEAVGQAIRLLSAYHRLSDKVLSGKPFAAELSAFEELAKPEESAGSPLASLAPYADSGIPTFATLLVTFDQSVDSLNASLSIPPANAGFWERLMYNLTHLISIRRIDDTQTGSTEQAIVGRAQAHLEREEIEAATAEIKSLPESVRGNFAAWLDDAQMVVEAPSFIDQLEEQVMQKAFHAEAKPTAQEKLPEHPSIPTQKNITP